MRKRNIPYLSNPDIDKWIDRMETHLFRINDQLEVLDREKKSIEAELRELRNEKRERTDA